MDLAALVRALDTQNTTEAFALQLSPAQWQRLSAVLERRTLAAGDLLMRRGERGGRAWLIESGQLQVFVSGGPPGSHRIATLRAGTVVGEPALFTDAPRLASVEAVTPCVVWAFVPERLETLARDEPSLVLAVLRAAGAVMVRRLQAHQERGIPIA
jgi:CRP-like cAMP-binding protein